MCEAAADRAKSLGMINTLSIGTPSVSVVMTVYNTELYLANSIHSILGQTFTDWELICVDDGSTDGSLEILRRYERADGRVRVVTRPNTGVTRARNDGIALARGRYIAVMNSDDIALPERLCRQVDYMKTHPECVGLGAAVKIVGPDMKPIYDEPKALDHETIDCQTMAGAGAAIHEPVAMFRAEAVRQLGGYRDEIFALEDMDMYLRLAEIGLLANLPDILLLYRLRLGSINRTQRALQAQYQSKILRDARIVADCRLMRKFRIRNSRQSRPTTAAEAGHCGRIMRSTGDTNAQLGATLGAPFGQSRWPPLHGKPSCVHIFAVRPPSGEQPRAGSWIRN